MEDSKKLKGNLRNSDKFVFKKRSVPKVERKETDIYISQKSSNKYYIERIEKLWTNGEDEVVLHALGGAIEQAIIIALQLKEKHCNTYELDVSTSSVDIIDDLIPTTDEDDFEFQKRCQSSVKIRIYKLKSTDHKDKTSN